VRIAHRKLRSLAVFLCLAFGASVSENGIIAQTHRADAPKTDQFAAEKAMAQLLGDFRVVAANLVWINVIDRYHHEFMREGGTWSKNVTLLPYLRLVVMLDPHFIEAYDIGALIECKTGHSGEGVRFLADGVRENPTVWELQYSSAMMRAEFLNDRKGAIPYAIAARQPRARSVLPKAHRFADLNALRIKIALRSPET